MLLTYEIECVGHSVYVANVPKGMCVTLGINYLRTKRYVLDTRYAFYTASNWVAGVSPLSVFFFFPAFHVAHMNVRN